MVYYIIIINKETYFSDNGRALVRSRNQGVASCEVGRRDTITGERWLLGKNKHTRNAAPTKT